MRGWIGCQRNIYNAKVEDMRYQLRLRKMLEAQFGVKPEFIAFDQEYSKYTSGVDFLKTVPSQVLRNGAYRFMQAISRWKKKLGGKPTRKKKFGKQSVLITSELFHVKGNTLSLGTKKFPLGKINISAHAEFTAPRMISISVDGDKWFVSFCNDDGIICPTQEELLAVLESKSDLYLKENAVGVDRGVVVNAYCSDKSVFVFSPEQQQSLLRAKAKKKRYEREMSRRFKKGVKKQSKNYYRAKASKNKAERKIKNIRLDFNHKTSFAIVNSDACVIFAEELKLKNMTKSVAPKQDDNGKYIANGKAAKSGLNKAILNNGLGQLIQFMQYKALKNHKLVLRVPAPYTSQKCSECHHTEKGNREKQADFTCLKCGHTENADCNASKNIRDDGIRLLLSGHYSKNKKERKRVRVGRNVARREEVSALNPTGSEMVNADMERHKETPSSAQARVG